jgi:hypothetical protein
MEMVNSKTHIQKRKKTKMQEQLEFVKERLQSSIDAKTEGLDDVWFYHRFLPAIKGLRNYYRMKGLSKEARIMTKYFKVFRKLEKTEKLNNVRLTLFCYEDTKLVKSDALSPEITEKYPKKDWDKDGFRILDKLDGVTEISFMGLNIEVPTKIVKHLEEVRVKK